MRSIIITLAALFLIAACSGKSNNLNANSVSPDPVKQEAATMNPSADLSDHPGKVLYDKQCLPCHQADGNGVPGMFPPLTATEWVDGDNARLISVVVHGLSGEIEVKGELYNSIMAPLPYLSDKEVMDVLNYVRKQFGTSENEITLDEVRKVRASGS
jgi:mono/diheme cytochrome c family protein